MPARLYWQLVFPLPAPHPPPLALLVPFPSRPSSRAIEVLESASQVLIPPIPLSGYTWADLLTRDTLRRDRFSFVETLGVEEKRGMGLGAEGDGELEVSKRTNYWCLCARVLLGVREREDMNVGFTRVHARAYEGSLSLSLSLSL